MCIRDSPHTINNLYRKYFEEVFDFTDATNYKLSRTSSGIVFNYLASNSGNTLRDISIPNKTTDDIRKEGLDVKNYNINFYPPNGITKYTLCIVFYLWRNRTFLLTKSDLNRLTLLLSLGYTSSDNKVSLTINKVKREFTIPRDFNGKKLLYGWWKILAKILQKLK